jgi:protein-S-isoprenylcysteine O-methyltransferase Ste14
VKTKLFSPAYLNALLIVEIALHFLLPIRQIITAPTRYLGAAVLILGVALNVYTVRYLRSVNTTSDFFETADRLVTSGPFRRSRNPIYLSGVLVSLGIAVFLGSLSPLAIPILIFLTLNMLHIPDEEARLEKLFGKNYLAYKDQVRRWL